MGVITGSTFPNALSDHAPSLTDVRYAQSYNVTVSHCASYGIQQLSSPCPFIYLVSAFPCLFLSSPRFSSPVSSQKELRLHVTGLHAPVTEPQALVTDLHVLIT
jgi:hypothetical protein